MAWLEAYSLLQILFTIAASNQMARMRQNKLTWNHELGTALRVSGARPAMFREGVVEDHRTRRRLSAEIALHDLGTTLNRTDQRQKHPRPHLYDVSSWKSAGHMAIQRAWAM